MELSNATGAPDYLNLTSSLAMEIAQQLSSPTEIFDRAGISKADAILLLKSPDFQAMIKAAKAEWESLESTPDRIRLKSQMALEELLLPQYQMARDARTPATARNDAFKAFERLSGVAKVVDESVGGTGPKFVLNINIGRRGQTLEGEVIEQEALEAQ